MNYLNSGKHLRCEQDVTRPRCELDEMIPLDFYSKQMGTLSFHVDRPLEEWKAVVDAAPPPATEETNPPTDSDDTDESPATTTDEPEETGIDSDDADSDSEDSETTD